MKIVGSAILAATVVPFLATGCKTAARATPEGSTTASADAASPDLQDNLDYIKKDASKMVRDSAAKLGAPANRDFHSRGICAKGKLTVDPGSIPSALRVALFSQKAVYPVYGRFSNGRPGRDSNDHDASVFGFGIKVIGVPGKKFDMQSLGSTKPVNANQDWNLATGETFPIPTAAVYREQRESDGNKLKTAAFAVRHPLVVTALLRGLRHIDSFFAASYYSQVALHFGEDLVGKFSAAPCNGVEKDISGAEAGRRSSDYLRQDLATKLASEGACFNLRVQVRQADGKLDHGYENWAQLYPDDNPTVLWPESVIPYITLAKIEFPPQPNIADLQPTCEALSINPGNTLQAFRPIESDTLMRARFLSAYEGSVTTREALNGKTQSEPGPIANVDSWLAN